MHSMLDKKSCPEHRSFFKCCSVEPIDSRYPYSMAPLTRSSTSLWAKSSNNRDQWLPLTQHLLDAASAADRLFTDWLAPATRLAWGEAFPGGEQDARLATVWLAACHDIGKASPAFEVQVGYLCNQACSSGLTICDADFVKGLRRTTPHSGVSYAALRQWLVLAQDFDPDTASAFASVVGAHHGSAVDGADCQSWPRKFPKLLGNQAWHDSRVELIEWVTEITGADARLCFWQDLELPLPVQVGISGLVVMADWLSSNERFFGYRPMGDFSVLDPPKQQERAEVAWAQLAMPPPWQPELPDPEPETLYAERFGWPAERHPNALQRQIPHLLGTGRPGLVFIEAAMGSGKTEAALLAAEILAARWGASGLYVALPTQATSDAMFTRVHRWLKALPAPPPDIPAWSVSLTHGKAQQNKEFAQLMADTDAFNKQFLLEGNLQGIHDPDESEAALTSYVAHDWFRGRKRALLSNFAIGTIDQLLQAALRSKHLMLRHLAFMGKVVIIDEAHASDHFMDTYLDRAVQWLGRYQVPVIVLSATLPSHRRKELSSAYLGREPDGEFAHPGRYPLVTVVDQDGTVRAWSEPPASATSHVAWQWAPATVETVVAEIESALAGGGCALVIRNTVRNAQATASALREASFDVTLNHSRFMSADRAARDQLLVSKFGPDGDRPEKHVVVATQVAEQSLDVDFDLLITDLAPIDLVLQRIGRMHRHVRPRPNALAQARVVLLHDEASNPTGIGPVTGDKGSRTVYGNHLLLRTASALMALGRNIALPGDIAPLVTAVFDDGDLDRPGWETVMAEAAAEWQIHLKKQEKNAEVFRLCTPDAGNDLGAWVGPEVSDPTALEIRGIATVRESSPSLEVILVPLDPSGSTAIVPPWHEHPATLDVRSLPDDETAHQILMWAIKLPPEVVGDGKCQERMIHYLSGQPNVKRWEWQRHPLLKGQLFLPMTQTAEGSHVLIASLPRGQDGAEWHLTYTPTNGLEASRNE